jgi:hypothetical protein
LPLLLLLPLLLYMSFRVDQPLLDSKGVRLVNFTRVETPGNNANNGNNDVNW